MASLAFAGLPSATTFAQPRPSLDDFYERSRSRAEGFDDCTGTCDGERVAAFLLGLQVADPSTDAVQRAVAHGTRLGLDLGMFWSAYSVVRTKAWSDFLYVPQSEETVTDLAWDTTLFHVLGDPGEPGMHLSLNTSLAQRTELEATDFAEFQLTPYRVGDVEVELAPTGPKVDKDAFVVVPFGARTRTRWDTSGNRTEELRQGSAAFAFRGFLHRNRHHYQLEAVRFTRKEWKTAVGSASSSSLSTGYQRLSPDVAWLTLWLLAGYGWHEGASNKNGLLAQLGAEMRFDGDGGIVELGPTVASHFVLDRATNTFARVHEGRMYYRHQVGILRPGLSYEGVWLEDVANLHAIVPRLGVRVFEAEITARYRVTFLRDARFDEGIPGDRFQLSADLLF